MHFSIGSWPQNQAGAERQKTRDRPRWGPSNSSGARSFGLRGLRAKKQRTLIRLALDFWSWRRLDREGLDDWAAADLMAEVSAHVSQM
jgi:hypothetical protein